MPSTVNPGALDELIVCSLEPWDEIWRRNQYLVSELLARNPNLRVLFVEPVVDLLFDALHRRLPPKGGTRQVRADGRLFATRPRKILPRVIAGEHTELHLDGYVRKVARRINFTHPVLWVNDDCYATLADRVPWPTLHDMTDDWLAAAATPRELGRRKQREASLSGRADVRVAVSPRLIENRGSRDSIRLIPDGVDIAHFQRPQERPADVPAGQFVVYVGTLHDDRIDVPLLADLARVIAPVPVIMVGPSLLSHASMRLLRHVDNCHLLGPRAYDIVPAYYQHAGVVVVPHRVSEFTESLDPIKAYEALAVGRPTVSTPVAGFRDLGPPIQVADRVVFPQAVLQLLKERLPSVPRVAATWAERAAAFEDALVTAVSVRSQRAQAGADTGAAVG